MKMVFLIQKKVKSDFLVAYSLLRSDFCDFGEQYVGTANPLFLERTIKGIVALRFGVAKRQKDVDKGIERLKELLPGSIHYKIDPIRKEAGWADPNNFL